MIRPSSLVRRDSDQTEFSAPATNIHKDAIDCGITAIPCCLPSWFNRFATPNCFLFFFAILGIIQGSVQKYFSTTARHVGEIFNYSDGIIDWLLISHDLFLGFFVLLVAYWGNRIHRPAWLGGMACFQGFSSLMVMIPYLTNQNGNETSLISEPKTNMCHDENPLLLNLELVTPDPEYNWIMLIVLFAMQLVIGLGNAGFFTLGISYIDDNVEDVNSPIYISFAIAIKLASFQFGTMMAWTFLHQEKSWWIGYPILGLLLILSGTLVAIFPMKLIGTVLKQTAASILDIATRSTADRDPPPSPRILGFGNMFKRIITNKVLIFNTLAVALMQMGMENFTWYEADFMESQFYLPRISIGFDDPWTSRLWKHFMKPPLVALVILITGLFISKINPRARILAGWSVAVTVLCAGVFFSYYFIDCHKDNIAGSINGKLLNPYCSFLCKCQSNAKFEPVCTQDTHMTYYSPCHAGCRHTVDLNDFEAYANCSCSSIENQVQKITTIATKGACNNNDCALYWVLFQSFTIFAAALLGSSYVGNFLIILRSVSVTDKALAIGFHICLVNILVHIPGKFVYKAITDANCKYFDEQNDRCNLYNEEFGGILSIVTSTLLVASAIMYSVVVCFVRDIQIIDEYEESVINIPMHTRPRMVATSESTEEPSSPEYLMRPRRAPRTSAFSSGASTRASSIQFNNPEQRPLTRDEVHEQRPLTRDEAHRSVVEELRHFKSTAI